MGFDQWMQGGQAQQAAFDKSMFDYYRNVENMKAAGSPARGSWGPVGPTPPTPQAPETPAPQPGGTPKSLGLGLGLNQGQRAGWQAAAQRGQGAQWLGEHGKIAQRVNQQIQAGSPAETRLQNFLATGASQAPYRANQQALLQSTMRR